MEHETKYKVGERITVRDDILVGQEFDGHCCFAEWMLPMLGGTFIIDEAGVNGYGEDRYYIERYGCNLSNHMIKENQFVVELI